jgi:hypothetical protein
MRIVGLLQPPILAEVVEAHYFISVIQQFLDQIPTDKAGSTSD